MAEEIRPLADRVVDGLKGKQQRLSPRQVELAAGVAAALEWLIECAKAEEGG